MEDGLGLSRQMCKHPLTGVLILVLMEDGLGRWNVTVTILSPRVLILVLMEDGLGPDGVQQWIRE